MTNYCDNPKCEHHNVKVEDASYRQDVSLGHISEYSWGNRHFHLCKPCVPEFDKAKDLVQDILKQSK